MNTQGSIPTDTVDTAEPLDVTAWVAWPLSTAKNAALARYIEAKRKADAIYWDTRSTNSRADLDRDEAITHAMRQFDADMTAIEAAHKAGR